MQYGQIVFILFILLLLYYAGMIVMDLMQAKAAQAAEHDNQTEEDIDITDEAETFRPIRVSRDEPKQKQTAAISDDTGHTEEGADSQEKAEDETEEENEEEAESGEEAPTADNEETSDETTTVSDENLTEQPVHTPGYREAIMTDGIEVEKLLEAINRLALDGTSVLGAIIYSCETME